MAKAFSDDLRRRFLSAYELGEETLEELAERFMLSLAYGKKLSAEFRRSGQMERVDQCRGAPRKLLDEHREQLRRWLVAVPDLTLELLREKLEQERGLMISRVQVARALKRMGLKLKKSHSTSQSATARKTAGGGKSSSHGSPRSRRKKLVFLDESGVTTRMTRLYARAVGGARAHESAPQGNWKILTILGTMSTRGMIAAMTVEAATDGEIFLAFPDEVLCAALQPGDVVIMDNLSSHKVDGVRERIERCQAELLYLPPYSPDLNPIEKA